MTSPLKSAEWLVQHLNDANLRVLDCRYALGDPLLGRIAYLEGHVPGAIYADLETDLSGPVQEDGAGGRHPLPDPETLADWLGSVGVGNDSVVVCYADHAAGGDFYASRAWWLLRWLGHREVYVLNGGWPAYVRASGPVTTAEPAHAPVIFTPEVQHDMVADAQDVQNRAGNILLIDSRAPDRYSGATEPIDRKAGHIPGAVNRPFTGALNPDGTYRDADGLRTHLNTDNAPTIAYCGSGVSATPNLLARELAGMPLGPQNRLYPGSWSDWISDDSREIATGEQP